MARKTLQNQKENNKQRLQRESRLNDSRLSRLIQERQ
jgi:hypothetical protein